MSWEQKNLVHLSSGDEGVRLGNKKFLRTCHHVMMVDVAEQKILVHLSSHDEGECCGMKNSCAPVIM
jgi:hypothetical protein